MEINEKLNHQLVIFKRNDFEVTLSDASGELYNWDSVCGKGLTGAALRSEKEKAAKEIGITALGEYLEAVND